jgi:uncharacterized membrane-anchored protein
MTDQEKVYVHEIVMRLVGDTDDPQEAKVLFDHIVDVYEGNTGTDIRPVFMRHTGYVEEISNRRYDEVLTLSKTKEDYLEEVTDGYAPSLVLSDSAIKGELPDEEEQLAARRKIEWEI